MRYLLIYGEVLPMLERSEGASTSTRRLLPLAEGGEVHTEPTQALNMRTSAWRGWRSTQAANLRGAELEAATKELQGSGTYSSTSKYFLFFNGRMV